VRKQYHFWPAERGFDAWDVDRLIALSRDLPVERVDVASIGELDTSYWFDGSTEVPTVRKVVEHCRLIGEVDILSRTIEVACRTSCPTDQLNLAGAHPRSNPPRRPSEPAAAGGRKRTVTVRRSTQHVRGLVRGGDQTGPTAWGVDSGCRRGSNRSVYGPPHLSLYEMRAVRDRGAATGEARRRARRARRAPRRVARDRVRVDNNGPHVRIAGEPLGRA